MSEDQKVAIITGGSQGIGAGLVAGYRQQGWAVVATSRTIKPAPDPDVLTVDGDVADPATAETAVVAVSLPRLVTARDRRPRRAGALRR